MKKILAYHSIGDPVKETGANLYCVSEANFRKQMKCAKDSAITITFDDGDITNYTKAYPILKALGMTAHFFIIGEWVGAPGYMDWRQIKELQDSGMTIGSHGMTHRILTTLSDAELDHEFTDSKKLLEENLKVRITSFSIPRGLTNRKVIEKAKWCGYAKIFTSNPHDNDGVLFGRIVVRSDWDMKRFESIVNNGPSFRDNAVIFIKNTSRKILGDENYDKLRTTIINLRPTSSNL
ncbi:MAG: polysaccharide deacetylase family protein [Candidatus Omnitrophica bacterium]|nr:polysaccharide deacetylase family protein [Candidatus Omnitrophota bacterium]